MHSKEVVADLEQFFDAARDQETPWRFARVLRPFIRRNIKLAECPSFGQTIFEYAPAAPGAADYRDLADGLIKEWDAMLLRQGITPPVAQVPVAPAPEQTDRAPEIIVPASNQSSKSPAAVAKA
jgi:chromosome partitioning protein